MSVTAKVMCATKELETTAHEQYLCSAQAAILDKIVAFNNSASATDTITVTVVLAGGTIGPSTQFVEKIIQPLEAYTFPELTGMTLGNGETVVTDTVNGALVFRMSGREIT